MQCRTSIIAVILLTVVTGCNAGNENSAAGSGDNAAAVKRDPAETSRSPGKPSAPVTVHYEVLGTAYVGQPVAVQIRVEANEPGQAMRVSYFINDTDSMMFADAQPTSIDIELPGGETDALRQVRLVPQREGRLYLNVTVEIDTADGTMLRSIAIPLSVGSSAVTKELNGDLLETADGETVISMPAREN